MFRLATESDLINIEQIYIDVIEEEARTVSYTNWVKDVYPTIEHAREALAQQTLFVEIDGDQIWGCVILNQIQPAEYANIDWQIEAKPDEIMVIHTLCLSPSVQGQGKGTAVVNDCEEYARSKQIKVVRLDTFEGNDPASKLYTKLGYRLAGITEVHFQQLIWENLKCFEKRL